MVVVRPTELVHQRSIGERRVCAATSHDHVGAQLESPHDRSRPDVRVGALHPVPHLGERSAGLHVRQLVTVPEQLIESIHKVVTAHEPDLGAPRDPRPASGVSDRFGTTQWIDAPGIRDHAHPSLYARRENTLHQGYEVPRVSRLRVSSPLLLHDGHGHLCEVVQHEIVDRTALDLADGRLQVVAPETLSARDANEAALVAHAPGLPI